MGVAKSCCSCLYEDSGGRGGEHELESMGMSAVRVAAASKGIQMDPSGLQLSGHGVGIGSDALEQDASYWEVHIKEIEEGADGVLGCGVVRLGDPEVIAAKQGFGNGPSTWGFTTNTAGVTLCAGDVVGVTFSQSDLPMLQFYLNGDRIIGTEIERVRGDVYPAVFVKGMTVTVAFCASRFKFAPPHSKFTQIFVTQNVL